MQVSYTSVLKTKLSADKGIPDSWRFGRWLSQSALFSGYVVVEMSCTDICMICGDSETEEIDLIYS